MKKAVLLLLFAVLTTLGLRAEGDTFAPPAQSQSQINRLLLGLNVQEATWVNSVPEFFPSIGLDMLVPCSPRFSLGAFVSYTLFDVDGGLLASWRMDNGSRLLGGLGWSRTFYTPLIRVGYKAPRRFYCYADFGPDGYCSDLVVGLGIGWFFIGR